METSIRIPLDEYHEYMGYIDATVPAGQMLRCAYPGEFIWKHRGSNVTISGTALANALADGAILVADSAEIGVPMLPAFSFSAMGVAVNSLAIVNVLNVTWKWSASTVGPRLLTRNPIEYYS